MAELIGAHLNGSVALGDARTVMTTCAEILGEHLRTLPDGEPDERINWHMWQGYKIFNPNPAIVTNRLAQDFAQWTKGKMTPQDAYNDNFDFSVDPNATEISFGELGYAGYARESYRVFQELKAGGKISPSVRFQVSLPSPVNPICTFMPKDEDRRRAFPPYEAAMLREVEQICADIPHEQLAIQWDCVVEVFALEGLRPLPWDDQEADLRDYVGRISAAVPKGVPVGFHLCYGDRRHTHLVEPKSLAVSVKLANLLVTSAGRPVSWMHMPVPKERDDADYFAPLSDLNIGETNLYLGLMHATDGLDGARRRIKAASDVCPRFGVATECGMGRRPPESIRPLLELHKSVLAG